MIRRAPMTSKRYYERRAGISCGSRSFLRVYESDLHPITPSAKRSSQLPMVSTDGSTRTELITANVSMYLGFYVARVKSHPVISRSAPRLESWMKPYVSSSRTVPIQQFGRTCIQRVDSLAQDPVMPFRVPSKLLLARFKHSPDERKEATKPE